MKTLPWGIFVTCLILLVSCEKRGVIVKLSLYDTGYYHKHYVKVEVHNNFDKDIYIPYFGDCISVYCNGVDVSELIRQGALALESNILSQPMPDTLALKGHQYIEGLVDYEFDRFLVHNKIDMTTMSEDELAFLREGQIDAFCTMKYFNGIFAKAGEIIERYIPISGLYCEYTGKPTNSFTIKFMRHSNYIGFTCDTIALDDYELLTDFPEHVVGYDLYAGPMQCPDTIVISK